MLYLDVVAMFWGVAERRRQHIVGCNTCVLAPPLTRTLSPSGRARYGPRPLSLLPQLPLHVTPASQVSATSDKPLALGHRDPPKISCSDSTSKWTGRRR